MSELKKDWRIELKEIVEQTVKTQLEASKPKEAPTPAPSAHKPHSLADLLDCPDCYPTIKKGVLEKEILSRKDKELECVDCGTRVDETEDSCPTCGGKDAEYR